MNNLSHERKSLGLTQKKLAELCGWNQSRIANYEAGVRKPGLSECRIIVEALILQGSRCTLDSVFPPSIGGENARKSI